ncbi:tripartite tricarboxylate transporter substrate-binding protein [Paracidovorax avenae]
MIRRLFPAVRSAVVSLEPGGSTDVSARAVAQALGAQLGQPVIVENRSGAGGRIGTKAAAQVRPDGYTLLWGSGSSLTAALRAGQFVPLFTTGDQHDPALPDTPIAAEAGLPELTILGFFGLLAPAGTPPDIVARLNTAIRAALASGPVARAFGPLGFTPAYSMPGEMTARIADGRATYARIVRERQIRPE